jgi:hypothetical protein
MRKLALIFALVSSSAVYGQSSPSDRPVIASGYNLAPGEVLVAVDGVPVTQAAARPAHTQGRLSGGLAQQKAQQQAAEGRCHHVGGGFGAGNYEGVGFSTVSEQHAISKCCYWGVRTPVDIGVARGRNGWYATVLYR